MTNPQAELYSNWKSIVLCFLFGILLNTSVFGQCKAMVKKKGLPLIAGYKLNGKMNTAILSPGEVAEMNVTFNQGSQYRIAVVSEDNLKDVQFRLLNQDKIEIFDSFKQSKTRTWDFKSETTQSFIIEVTIPPSASKSPIEQTGCVSILLAYKTE
jgi:hypothetical protein